jgi:enoyl-CoA hydratase/carnithine racemase
MKIVACNSNRPLAEAVAAGAPLSIAASRAVVAASLAMPDLDDALRADYPEIARMEASEDAIEGQAAFIEKRAPIWRGR